jgi:hypothetical protein
MELYPMSSTGWHHTTETKARMRKSQREARAFRLLTGTKDDLAVSYRYSCALATIRQLKNQITRIETLNKASDIGDQQIGVKTHGDWTPASGLMLWRGGNFALVWFDGADAPTVCPFSSLVIDELKVAAE